MNLNRVSIFVHVVEQGGFTAAARVLGLPKSSVSRAVALLEEELGARLLARSTRKVRLTEAGGAFHERAARGLAGIEEAASAVADLQGDLGGTIRITAPVDAGVWLLQPALSRFVAAHPGVRLEVVLTQRVVDLVEEGFDLALRAGPLADGALIARKLPSGDLGLYASAAYLRRRKAPRTVAELAQHSCVLFRPVRGRATWTLSGPTGTEVVEVTGPLGCDDFSFVRGAVLGGSGIGLLPAFLCRPAGSATRLVRVLPAYAHRGAPMHLVYPSARYVPQRVAALRDFLLEHLR